MNYISVITDFKSRCSAYAALTILTQKSQNCAAFADCWLDRHHPLTHIQNNYFKEHCQFGGK